MALVINDFFVPGYLEDALSRAGKFLITTASPVRDGITVRHLHVDREVLRIAGRELRNRRDELLGRGDREGWERADERLSGVRALVTDVARHDSTIGQEARKILPRISGFSPEMVGILLGSFASLSSAMGAEDASGALPPNHAALEFVRTASGYARYYSGLLDLSLPRLLAATRRHRARPVVPLPVTGMPRLVSSIAAGNVPGIAIMQAFLSLFVGAASLGKNASAEPYFGPRLLAELAVLESERGLFPLSDLVALVTFHGADRSLLEELVHQGDHLQATGGLDSQRDICRLVRRLRPRSPRDFKRRVSGHWHKVSFDVVAKERLGPDWHDAVAFNVAFDNSMFDTQGCLSAQQVFVEGTEGEVLLLAERFVEHMRTILQGLPKGSDPHGRLREMYEWYENRPGVTILTSLRDMQTHPFFVACELEAKEFAVFNALNRSILIRRVDRLETDLPRLLGTGEKRGLLQSCGVAIPHERFPRIAEILGRAGVNRIVAAGDIWNMRLGTESWDGYMPPMDLVAPQLGYWTTIPFHDLDRELVRVGARNRAFLSDRPAQVPSRKVVERPGSTAPPDQVWANL